jgi:hypothetical protein
MCFSVFVKAHPVRNVCQFFKIGYNKIVSGMSFANAVAQEFFRGRNTLLERFIFFEEVILSLKGSKTAKKEEVNNLVHGVVFGFEFLNIAIKPKHTEPDFT